MKEVACLFVSWINKISFFISSDIVHHKKKKSKRVFTGAEEEATTLVKFQALLKCDNCEFLNKKSHTPFVELDTKIRVNKRQIRRRSVTQDKCTGKCCRKPMTVSFKKLGWEFVFFPQEYEAYYCGGSCPSKAHASSNGSSSNTDTSKHSLLVEAILGTKTKANYCCTPKSFGPLTIIYRHEGSVIRRHVPDMIVNDCWCV